MQRRNIGCSEEFLLPVFKEFPGACGIGLRSGCAAEGFVKVPQVSQGQTPKHATSHANQAFNFQEPSATVTSASAQVLRQQLSRGFTADAGDAEIIPRNLQEHERDMQVEPNDFYLVTLQALMLR